MAELWSFRDDVGADRADLTGMTVEGVDGSVGNVKDVVSDLDGAYLLVDTGLPLVGSTVLVPAGLVTAIDVGNKSLKVDRTKRTRSRAHRTSRPARARTRPTATPSRRHYRRLE